MREADLQLGPVQETGNGQGERQEESSEGIVGNDVGLLSW